MCDTISGRENERQTSCVFVCMGVSEGDREGK